MSRFEVNGRTVDAQDGETLLTAVRRAGHRHPDACAISTACRRAGACRMCVVEVEGQRSLVPSCAFPVADGHEGADALAAGGRRAARRSSSCCSPTIRTTASTARATATASCRRWPRSWACGSGRYFGGRTPARLDVVEPVDRPRPGQVHPVRQVRAGVRGESRASAAIDFIGRGSHAHVGPAFDEGLNVQQLHQLRPVRRGLPDRRACRAQRTSKQVLAALGDPNKLVVVQHAPSVSVSLAEEFGVEAGRGRGRRDDRRRCAAWASSACSTRRSPPTSRSWRRRPSWCSA